jgi:CRP/FNR family transcriptional regulator, anaerobic regulatory protein
MKNASGNGLVCVSRMIPSLAQVSDAIRSELNQICQIKRVATGEVLAQAGDHPGTIGFVTKGILRMQKTLPDGRQHVVGLLVPGDLFGRVFDDPINFSIEAATDATLVSFRRAPFEALLSRSPELERLILIHFLTEIDRARDWMIVLSNPRVRGRLAGFLLKLCTRFRGGDTMTGSVNGQLTIRNPICRADLANLLGARPESISRAFHALADDGVLKIIRPDLVAIPSIEDLAEEAGEPELGDMITGVIPNWTSSKSLS